MVRGEGEVRVMPDLAVLRVIVEGDGPSRDNAYDAAAPLAAAVDDVIRQHNDLIGRDDDRRFDRAAADSLA